MEEREKVSECAAGSNKEQEIERESRKRKYYILTSAVGLILRHAKIYPNCTDNTIWKKRKEKRKN